ncbi:MAG TPA: hypothetical protein VN788_07680 [Verrucomicrobiae bacterium]|nr:hypothetical protein [Verrucomicrobiae bacterium]
MKRMIGIAAFIMFFAIPAHAQRGGASSSAAPRMGGGGGIGGSGGGMGNLLPAHPPTHFKMSAVSGSDASFIPSGYLPFESAVAEGQAILDAEKKTPAEAAAASSIVPKPHAKVAVVQSADGDPIVIQQ